MGAGVQALGLRYGLRAGAAGKARIDCLRGADGIPSPCMPHSFAQPPTQVAEEMREHMAAMGFRTVDEMIGRADMLEPNTGGASGGRGAGGQPARAASC